MKKRILSLVMALVLAIGLLPMSALAEELDSTPTSVTVTFTAQAEGAFLCAPQFNAEVPSNLAESYGYTDNVENGVSALDVLVKAHEVVFGDNFVYDAEKSENTTTQNYLVVETTDYDASIKTLFGVETGNCGFTVNGSTPHGAELIKDEFYGDYYLGYTIAQAEVTDNSFVEFFLYQDTYSMDLYTGFYKDDVKLDSLTAYCGTTEQLTLKGYSIGWYGCNTDAVIASNTSRVKDAQLAWVDAETGDVTSAGAVTDENGQVTITIPSEAGVHYLTASVSTDDGNTPIIMSLLQVTANVLPDASITVPSNATLFVGTKPNNKHYVSFIEMPAVYSKENADDTTTYYYELSNNSSYNYRVSGEDYVTYAGTFKKTADYTMRVTANDLQPAGKSKTTVDHNVTANSGYNVADIYLNINPQGYLKMSTVGDTYQLVNLRNWETVDTIFNNYFIEPDYHYTVIDENGAVSNDVVTVDENGVVKAVGTGTAIVLVTYDAINVNGALGGSFFGAIWPENTGVFVVSVGAEDSGISTGMTLNEGMNSTDSKLSGDALDAEHDVIYFTGDTGSYTFTPGTKGVDVSVANPTVTETMTFSGFSPAAANSDGSFTIPLVQGRNIVKLEKDDKAEYQVITAKKVSYTINGYTPDTALTPGSEISIQFGTLYHPANKLAGVYNMSAVALYTNVDGYAGRLAGGTSNQYQFASNLAAQTINGFVKRTISWGVVSYSKDASLSFSIPSDWAEDTFTLSGGTLFASGYGDPYGNHRGITLTNGKAPNFNANVKEAYLGQLPDIVIPVTTSKTVTSIEISAQPDKTEYFTGDRFDPAGMVVKASYSDNTTNEAVTSYTVSPETLTEDTTSVTVTYGGQTAAVPVTVTQPKVTSIAITKAPAKTTYTAGDTFDPTGMVVTATYENGKTAPVTSYTYSPNRTLTESDTAMTITYTGSDKTESVTSVTQAITVNAAPATDPSNPAPQTITVSFTLLGDVKHGDPTEATGTHTLKASNLDTWIAKSNYTVSKNSTVLDVLVTALAKAGFPYENPTGNYVTSIRGLAEMDNGSLSGWMYTLNGNHSTLGVSEQVLKNGDVIVFHYTDDYTVEKGSEQWSGGSGGGSAVSSSDQAAADKVAELIAAIGAVTDASGDKIAAARNGYDALTAAQKKLVSNYAVLTAAEQAYGQLTGTEGLPFTDVAGHWALDAIRYVYEQGLMTGTTTATFSPEKTITRGMIAAILYRLEGSPDVSGGEAFSDVDSGMYYGSAIQWAQANGIVEGYTSGRFGPDDAITREQLAVILYRYAAYKKLDVSASADLSGFADQDQISDYAADALSWANAAGLITGTKADTLSPKGSATRAQAAAILMRFLENTSA